MTYEQFLSEVMERTGLGKAQAELAVESCLRALADGVSELSAHRLRGQLPPELSRFLHRHGPVQTLSCETLFKRVSEFEGVRIGLGLEHAEVVLQTLYGLLDEEAKQLLHEDLPESLIEIASARPSYHRPEPRPIPPPKTARRTSSGTSLAEGRVGSSTPISEAGKLRAGEPKNRAAVDEDEDELDEEEKDYWL